MPHEHFVDYENGIVRTRIAGKADLSTCYQAADAVAANPQVSCTMAHLVDLREMDFVPSVRESIEFANFLAARDNAMRTSIAVVFSDPLVGALARMTASYARIFGIRIRPFRSEDAALAWLLDQQPAPPLGWRQAS